MIRIFQFFVLAILSVNSLHAWNPLTSMRNMAAGESQCKPSLVNDLKKGLPAYKKYRAGSVTDGGKTDLKKYHDYEKKMQFLVKCTGKSTSDPKKNKAQADKLAKNHADLAKVLAPACNDQQFGSAFKSQCTIAKLANTTLNKKKPKKSMFGSWGKKKPTQKTTKKKPRKSIFGSRGKKKPTQCVEKTSSNAGPSDFGNNASFDSPFDQENDFLADAGAPPPYSPYGQPPAYGQSAYGQSAYGQPPYAPPAYGQPPYAPPAYGQPGYAPPAYGQPPYAQPSQMPYGPAFYPQQGMYQDPSMIGQQMVGQIPAQMAGQMPGQAIVTQQGSVVPGANSAQIMGSQTPVCTCTG